MTDRVDVTQWLSALVVITCGYIALFALASPFVLLDFPNHFARCAIIHRLWFEHYSPFSALFSFQPGFAPYILHDIGLSLLLTIMPPIVATKLWVLAALLLPGLAVLVYLKEIGIERRGLLLGSFILLYIATDWFFLNGFLSYRFGMAFAFLGLACWERQLRQPTMQAKAVFELILALITALLYLTHLASFLFFVIALGASALYRLWTKEIRTTDAVAGALPAALVSMMHLVYSGVSSGRLADHSAMTFRAPLEKILAVGTMFVRFNLFLDFALFALLALVLLAGFLRLRKIVPRRQGEKALELGFTAAVLVLAFLCLPVAAGNVYDVDDRALPFIFIFLLASALTAAQGRVGYAVWLGSCVIAGVNLAYLIFYLVPINDAVAEYIEAVDHVPPGKRVLPVATAAPTGRMQPDLHWGSLYLVRREGVVPYLFSGDKADPVAHFRYRDRPSAPLVYWYDRKLNVNWEKVRFEYDYLLVTKPFDERRLDPPDLQLVYENEAAAIFAFRGRL